MPVTEINIAKGKDKKFLRQLMDEVHSVLVQTLELPKDDKNIRLKEFDPDFFDAKKPYEIFIEITLFSGRTTKTKKELYKNIVYQLNKQLSVDINTVFIILNEQPLENWGIRGGLSALDVNLGFKVNK